MGIVLNGHRKDKSDLAEETNPAIIAELTGEKVLTIIPYDKRVCVGKGQLGDDIAAAAGLVNWVDLMEEYNRGGKG